MVLHVSLSSFFSLINCLYFGCAGSSLLSRGLLELWQVGASVAWVSHCSGFSYWGAQALVHGRPQLWHRAWLPWGMWGLPRTGIEPVAFFSILPPGKSSVNAYDNFLSCSSLFCNEEAEAERYTTSLRS